MPWVFNAKVAIFANRLYSRSPDLY